LKRYKSPGSDQLLAELIHIGGAALWSVIHKLISSILNKEKLSDQWKEYVIVPVHKRGNTTDCNKYHMILLLSYRVVSSIFLSRLSYGINSADFDVPDQLLIRLFAFIRFWREDWSAMRQYFSYS
jgi:hypothetical protein